MVGYDNGHMCVLENKVRGILKRKRVAQSREQEL